MLTVPIQNSYTILEMPPPPPPPLFSQTLAQSLLTPTIEQQLLSAPRPTETHLWFCTCAEKNSSRLFSCVRMQKANFEIYCQICARRGACVKERIRSKGSRARNAWMVMEEFRDVDKSHWAFVKHYNHCWCSH